MYKLKIDMSFKYEGVIYNPYKQEESTDYFLAFFKFKGGVLCLMQYKPSGTEMNYSGWWHKDEKALEEMKGISFTPTKYLAFSIYNDEDLLEELQSI